MQANSPSNPVGVFDSGIGGISVLTELNRLLPNEHFIYFADSNNCPYGTKTQEQVIELCVKITDFLISRNCKIIVVACNTATAAAIEYLRLNYQLTFIGMEPAVKPAALNTKTGNIGILATQGTFQGKLFKETSKKWAEGKNIHIQVGEGLVEIVESGKTDTPETIQLLKKYLDPMIENHVDQIVLGCTHYPFLLKQIENIVSNSAMIINPAPAIAKRLQELLTQENLTNIEKKNPKTELFVNGKKNQIEKLLNQINFNNHNYIITENKYL